MLVYPHIDPIAIQLGPFAIRWYALAYLAGVLIGWWLIGKLNRRTTPPTLSTAAYDDLMVYAIIGIILGGRLGYVLFYNPSHYFENPREIFMIWKGGMAFHGGLLGMMAAMLIFARRYHTRFLSVMDLLAVVAPIGLFFGRIANFINGELYGRVTESGLGMIFPNGGPEPRYPSQLFEAGMEGILLFALLITFALRTTALSRTGRLSGIFLIGYSVARIIGELFREPDYFIGYLQGGITMGQLLSFPMLVLGIYLVVRRDPAAKTH